MHDEKTTLNIRISATLKKRATVVAAKDHRSLTSLIEKLLDDHCRASGSPEKPK